MPRFVSVLLALVLATPALALDKAPEPKKAIEIERFMGRWYEILRTPNAAQKNCHGAFQVWSKSERNRFSIAQNCHKDSLTGELKTVQTAAKIIDPSTNAKFEASFFGGLIKQQYWVLDRAEDYGWMIASTSKGNYVALLSRRPTMPAAEVAALTARMDAMGLNTAKLVAMGAK